MKKNKSKVIAFLLASLTVLNAVKTSVLARKQDSKNKADNAPRFLAINSRQTNLLNDFIETFKGRLFADVKAIYGQFIGKQIIAEVFIETTLLDGLPCVEKAHKNLMRRYNEDGLLMADFLKALKTALSNHVKATKKSTENAMANLSVKAQAVFKGNEKENFIVYVTNWKPKAKAKSANA